MKTKVMFLGRGEVRDFLFCTHPPHKNYIFPCGQVKGILQELLVPSFKEHYGYTSTGSLEFARRWRWTQEILAPLKGGQDIRRRGHLLASSLGDQKPPSDEGVGAGSVASVTS